MDTQKLSSDEAAQRTSAGCSQAQQDSSDALQMVVRGSTGVPIRQQVHLVESESRPMGVQLVNVRQTNKVTDPMDLVELAKQVQKAGEFTRANAGNKLTVIVDQMRYLQEQARKVLEEAQRDAMLHQAACNVVKRPGTVYYLYERDSGQRYFSILSPKEWGSSCPHEFVGAYKLEHDMSWTPFDKIEERAKDLTLVDKIMTNNRAIMDAKDMLITKS